MQSHPITQTAVLKLWLWCYRDTRSAAGCRTAGAKAEGDSGSGIIQPLWDEAEQREALYQTQFWMGDSQVCQAGAGRLSRERNSAGGDCRGGRRAAFDLSQLQHVIYCLSKIQQGFLMAWLGTLNAFWDGGKFPGYVPVYNLRRQLCCSDNWSLTVMFHLQQPLLQLLLRV